MFCEHCHGRAANVHLVRIINGKKSELHLCNECAQGERFKQTENLLNYSIPKVYYEIRDGYEIELSEKEKMIVYIN